MRNNESINIKASGDVKIYMQDQLVAEYHNELIPTELTKVIVECLRGFKNDNLPAFIYVGSGGDLNPITKTDTGERVAPVSTETEIRSLLYEAPILLTKSEKLPTTAPEANTVVFRAAINPPSFSSIDINELALVTGVGDMVAHWVSPEIAPRDRATKYKKTNLLWMIIEWAITFNITIA